MANMYEAYPWQKEMHESNAKIKFVQDEQERLDRLFRKHYGKSGKRLLTLYNSLERKKNSQQNKQD